MPPRGRVGFRVFVGRIRFRFIGRVGRIKVKGIGGKTENRG